MACIEKRKGKRSLTYRITVTRHGKPHRTSYKPEPGLPEAVADKEAEKAAFEFENAIEKGYRPGSQYTVAEWIDYVVRIKEFAERKQNTIESYRFAASKLPPAFLHRKLVDIRPNDIQEVLMEIQSGPSGQRKRAKKKEETNFWKLMAERKLTKASLCSLSGIASSTLDNIFAGQNVLCEKAEAVALALKLPFSDLFESFVPEKQLTSSTLQVCKRFLSMLFGVAVRERLIQYNPVSMIEQTSRKKQKMKHHAETLQIEEVAEVLAAVENEPLDKQCLVHMLLMTGCRRGEIAAMRWSKIDWENSTILIDCGILYSPETKSYEDTTKTDNAKVLKLPEETMDLLFAYKQWQEIRSIVGGDQWTKTDYIFTNKHGGIINPDTIYGYLRRFQEKYNLPKINPHKFRHTMASLLIYAGADIVSVSKRLGHAKVSTTQDIYSHLIRRADVESAEHIADIVLRGKKPKK